MADEVIEGAEGQGISIDAGAAPVLTGNRSCDNGENLVVEAGSEAVIDDQHNTAEKERAKYCHHSPQTLGWWCSDS